MENVGAAISATTAAIQLVQTLRNVDKSLSQAETRHQMAEILTKLTDVKLALLEAREDIADRDGKIAELQKAIEFNATLTEHKGFQYRAGADGKPLGKPFCPVCIQKQNVFVSLVPRFEKAGKPLCCPSCDGRFTQVAMFEG